MRKFKMKRKVYKKIQLDERIMLQKKERLLNLTCGAVPLDYLAGSEQH